MPFRPFLLHPISLIGRWLAFFRRVIPVAGPYWNSEDRWRVRGLTAALLALTIGQIVIAISINLWIQNFFDALESRALNTFVVLVGVVIVIIAANIAVTVVHLAVKRRLQVGWRRWLTHRLLGEWMSRGNHYRVTLFPGEHDNPDGRIAEDIRIATEAAMDLAHSLFHAVLLLAGFATVLWTLSGPPELSVAGVDLVIPGHLVWIAVLYSAIGTLVAWLLGYPLVAAQNRRQMFEANFRFGLAHAREHSVQIALLRGDGNEGRNLRGLFRGVAKTWNRQTRALANLFYFTSAWWVLSQVFPIMVAAPRYMAGAITLGVLMQTAQAFQQMVGALSWPIDNVNNVAGWRASVERVLGLHDALGRLNEKRAAGSGRIIQIERGTRPALAFEGLSIASPDGATITKPFSAEIGPGEKVAISGDPDTAFKFLKVVAGLWPWGSGRLILPASGPLFFMPRRPYLPLRTLCAAVTYPAAPQEFGENAVAVALTRVGLEHLIPELEKSGRWGETLSEDEQQRLGFARLLLFNPGWVFMQETLDTLAPETRESMLRLLGEELSGATFIIVGREPEATSFATAGIEFAEGGAVESRGLRHGQAT